MRLGRYMDRHMRKAPSFVQALDLGEVTVSARYSRSNGALLQRLAPYIFLFVLFCSAKSP